MCDPAPSEGASLSPTASSSQLASLRDLVSAIAVDPDWPAASRRARASSECPLWWIRWPRPAIGAPEGAA